MKLRALTLALGAVVLAIALSSCGASSKSAVDPVVVAAQKTVAAKTVHYSMTIKEQVSSLPAPVSLTAEGAMDFAGKRMSMSMDMSQLASLGGSALGSSASDWKIEAVIDGLVMYMKAPFLQTLVKSDKPWIKLDMESIGKQEGLDLSSLMSYDPSQLTRFVDYLRGSKDMQVLNHEQVRGTETTHYQGYVDFDAYLKALPADQRAAAKKALDSVSKLGKPVYSLFDVWVDGQQRVRREKFDYSLSAASAGSMKIAFVVDFFDYDVPVSITVPPADQTVDLMQVVGALGNR